MLLSLRIRLAAKMLKLAMRVFPQVVSPLDLIVPGPDKGRTAIVALRATCSAHGEAVPCLRCN